MKCVGSPLDLEAVSLLTTDSQPTKEDLNTLPSPTQQSSIGKTLRLRIPDVVNMKVSKALTPDVNTHPVRHKTISDFSFRFKSGFANSNQANSDRKDRKSLTLAMSGRLSQSNEVVKATEPDEGNNEDLLNSSSSSRRANEDSFNFVEQQKGSKFNLSLTVLADIAKAGKEPSRSTEHLTTLEDVMLAYYYNL